MRFLFTVILAMAVLPLRAAEQTIEKGSVVVLPVEGAISEAQFFFMRRVLKNAESAGAAALILDMDTPGGALKSTEQIVQMLMKSSVPVYTYVNTNAGSAGALIALGTKKVFMAPISAIGAAAPVVSSGEEIPATMNAKIVSYYSGYFRSVAERNGYHPELVDGFMNLDKEVKVGNEVINPKGSLLTLSAQEAVKTIGDRPLLASGIAKDINEVCNEAGLAPCQVVKIQPSGFEILAQWITLLAPVLLLGGIIGAYIEFKSTGTIVPGVLSAVCFLLFFTGHYIAGLTGLEVAAVFAVGLLLVLLELLFFPGVALVAALGVALMIGALFFAMVDFYPAEPLDFSFELVARPMLNLSLAIIASAFSIAILARFLPDLPVFRRLFLSAQSTAGPSIPAAEVTEKTPALSIGDTGTARSILRPSGKAVFGELLVDVVTQGQFVEEGTPVRVLSISGDAVVVERA
ncbi:MAG: NfeD family protein [Verrucomicrobiota bacterium]